MNMGWHDNIFIDPGMGIPVFQGQQLLLRNFSSGGQCDHRVACIAILPYEGQWGRGFFVVDRHIVVPGLAVIVVFQAGMFSAFL